MKHLKWLSPLILITVLVTLVGCSAQDPAEKWYSAGLIPGSSTSNNTIGDNISPFDKGGFKTLYITDNTSLLDFNGNPISLGGGGGVGPPGPAGPNNISTNTTTSLSGLLTGVSGNVSSIPLSGNTSLYLNQNGAWTVPADNDTITSGTPTNLTGVLAGVGGSVNGIDPTGQTGKVLYSDGTNASWQTVPTGGTLTYYFTGTNSTLTNGAALITTDKQMTYAPFSPITNIDAGQDANSDVILQTFATNSGIPNLAYIPAGQWLLHVHAAITAGSRFVTLYGVFREVADNGTNIGTIGTQTESSAQLTGVQTEYQLFMSTSNTYSMNSTASRIVVDVHAVFTNHPPNGTTTVRMQVGGTADSHIALPSATIDASNFVPYTGATADLNIGIHNFIRNGVVVAVSWRGAYDNATAYIVGDGVSYLGSSYICKLATTGHIPTDTTYWDVLASQGSAGSNGSNGSSIVWRGAWVSATSYSVLDAVSYGNSSYICKSATSGTTAPPSDATHWDSMALGSSFVTPTYVFGLRTPDIAKTPSNMTATYSKAIS